MNYPFALSLFLADGTANGLKIIEKFNWNGCGLSCPKKVLFEKHRKRTEFNKPGVYFLVGENDENVLSKRIYIGEADPVMPRLEEHFRRKEWWTDVIVFTATDQMLNKAFVQYFEAQLVQLAHKAKRYCIENGNIPVVATLSEREIAICEGFLREILLCLPLLGINFAPTVQSESKEDEILIINRKGVVARGFETSDGFVVLASSEVVPEEARTIPNFVHHLRQNFFEQGVVCEENQKLKFTVDHCFGSPSTAASFILGCPCNGRETWKSLSGISLKSIQLSKLDQ